VCVCNLWGAPLKCTLLVASMEDFWLCALCRKYEVHSRVQSCGHYYAYLGRNRQTSRLVIRLVSSLLSRLVYLLLNREAT
jgi:hypothetical protein